MKRWSSPAATSATSWVCSRAAASSIASGRPSRRRTISATQRQLVRIGLEPRRHRARPLEEQLHRRAVAVGDERQRRHHLDLLAGDAQPFAARRHDAHVRAHRQHPLDERGDRVEHVLAVVEQHAPARPAPSTSAIRSMQRRAEPDVDAERGGHDVERRCPARRSPARRAPPAGRGGAPAAGGRPRAAAGSCRHRRARRASPAVRRPPPRAARRSARRARSATSPGSAGGGRSTARCSATPSSSACWVTSAGDGSMPSSSPSIRRKSSYTRSASARRPLAANAAISSWRGRSRNGCSAASAARSAMTPSASPRASRDSACTSRARARSSSPRATSARASSTSASSG